MYNRLTGGRRGALALRWELGRGHRRPPVDARHGRIGLCSELPDRPRGEARHGPCGETPACPICLDSTKEAPQCLSTNFTYEKKFLYTEITCTEININKTKQNKLLAQKALLFFCEPILYYSYL
jgi:hypothetical protein